MDNHETPRTGRRKSCDACRVRKSKCDRKRPVCLQCSIYGSQCSWDTKERPVLSQDRIMPRTKKVDSLQKRLGQIESSLAAVLNEHKAMKDASEASAVRKSTHPADPSSSSPSTDTSASISTLPTSATPPSTTSTPAVAGRAAREYERFSLLDVAPIINAYLEGPNQLMPLFDRCQVEQLVQRWFERPSERDDSGYAAINVLLALSLQNQAPEQCTLHDHFQRYFQNAKTALDLRVVQDVTLQNLQTILGLVMLYRGVSDVMASAVAMSIASRMVYQLQLHRQSKQEDPQMMSSDTEEAARTLHADRVFWVAYVLDRNASQRSKSPCMLPDGSFDQDMALLLQYEAALEPSLSLLVVSPPTSVHLARRVELARIEGKLYEWVYSLGAKNVDEDTKEERINEIDHMLANWLASIPEDLHPSVLQVTDSDRAMRRYMTSLYVVYFHSVFETHGIFLHNDGWMDKLTRLSKCVMDPSVDAVHVFPPQWDDLVETARKAAEMFLLVDRGDMALVFEVRCAYLSALTILIANRLGFYPPHLRKESDEHLIAQALQFLRYLHHRTKDERLAQLEFACTQLIARTQLTFEDPLDPDVPFPHQDLMMPY